MKLIIKIEDKTGKEIKELYAEFMDLPHRLRLAIDVAAVLSLFLLLVNITPALKYSLLNAFGTPSVTIKITDSQSGLPLIDAEVKIDQKTLVTDKNGIAKIDEIPFGNNDVVIKKAGYDTISSTYLVKSVNSQFEERLKSNGRRIVVEAKQYLSTKPVDSFIVRTTDDSKLTAVGVDGRAVIVVPAETTLELGAEVSASNFLSQKATLNTRDEKINNSLIMVPQGEHYFLASRGGATTIYRSHLDGAQQERLIEPTGFEGADSKFFVTPNAENAVYQTTRRPASTQQLYLVNLKSKKITEFDSGSPAWQILDVNDTRVVYVADKGNPADNKNQTLKTYNFQTGEVKELIESPAMSFSTAAGGKIVFAELIERGSYPGGFLLRQLLAVNESDGKFEKLSENATITDIGVATPTKIQYTQLNPGNEAEVRFVFDTISGEVRQASVDRTAKTILSSPFEPNYFAWTIGATTLEFGNSEMEVKSAFNFTNPDLRPKRWISKDYIILDSAEGTSGSTGLLIRAETGKSAQLP